MIRRLITPLAALLTALLAVPAFAAAAADNPHTRVTLIAASRAPAPGQPLAVGLAMVPKPGWHTYWQNPGDAGVETRAAWSLPKGATASPLSYPVPGKLLVSGLMNYVYSGPNTLLATIKLPALPVGAALPLKVKLDWLVCSDSLCVPESAALDLPLTIGTGAADPATAAQFAAAKATLPKPVDWPARYSLNKDRLRLSVPFGSPDKVRSAYFFAAEEGVIDYAAPQLLRVSGTALVLDMHAGGKPTGPIHGVLKVEMAGAAPIGFAITATPGSVAAGAPLAAGSDSGESGSKAALLPALALAVLGGLLLNVMPCVFPILSLKALSLAKATESQRQAQRDALAYAAGVVLVCTALGAVILGVRAAGTQIGWAFQLQDPRVITLLLLLMTAIALNLAGLFEISMGGGFGQSLVDKGGTAGSFWTGALAAFVATPCTGPFMAGALGAALVLPPAAGLLVFAGLGLGLALPFLALGFIPALRHRLPRPGAWMQTFRHLLSIPMFLTAVGLAWVLGRQAGVNAQTLGLIAALLLGLALWWLGARQRGGGKGWLPIGLSVASAVAAVLLLGKPVQGAAPVQAAQTETLGALPFSPARLAALQAAGTPAFVYFTADWCLTCKVNERGALASSDVADAFRKAGVAVLVGDWTNGDATIGAFLENRGRSGVPLYLFYARGGHVTELPQLLTPDALVALTAQG